ncbi:MAG: hypothetical protein GXY43_08460 [Clostridiaceae bacterium]|nr:hypothetical protein [Clostridiaceae bacterium]
MSLRFERWLRILLRSALAILLVAELFLLLGCSGNRKTSIKSTTSYIVKFQMNKTLANWTEALSGVIGAPIRESDTDFISMKKGMNATYVLAMINSKTSVIRMDEGYGIESVVSLDEKRERLTKHFFPIGDESVFLLVQNSEEGLWSRKYALRHFDADGRELSSQIELEELDGTVIREIDFDNDHFFHVITSSHIFIFDTEGILQNQFSSPDKTTFLSMLKIEDDVVMILSIDLEGRPYLITRSLSKNKVLSKMQITGIEASDWYNARLIRPAKGDSAGCYVETEKNVYECDPDFKQLIRCIDKIAEGFYSEWPLLCTGVQTFETFGVQGFSGGLSETNFADYGFYSIVLSPGVENKTILRIGLCCGDTERVSLYGGIFQRSYPEYVIEFIDYRALGGSDLDPITRLNADLLSGNGPDIVCLGSEYIYRYEFSDLFIDLGERFKTDTSFDSNLLLPNVWGGSEYERSFRLLAPFFSIRGFMGKNDLVSKIKTYDSKGFEAFMRNLPENTHIIRHDTDKNLFSAFYPYYEQIIFYRDSGAITFDRQEFINLLTLCENFGKPPYKDSKPIAEQLQDHDILLLNEIIFNCEYFLCFAEYFNEEVGYMGAPGIKEGSPIIRSDQYFGISAKTNVPDDAWMFLKFLLSENIQDRYSASEVSGDMMPVLRSSLDKMIHSGYDRYLKGESIRIYLYSDSETEIMDEQILLAEETGNTGALPPDNRPSVYPFSETEAKQAFMEIVLSARIPLSANPDITGIVFEELKAFFSGHKTKEDCLSIIENRLQTYIAENREAGW